MDCRTFRNRIEDYLEEGLDFAGRFGMERHAQQCFTCGKMVADAQKLSEMVRSFKGPGAPPDFEAAVLRRIQTDRDAHSRWRGLRTWFWCIDWRSWRLLAAGASALGVAGLGVFLALHARNEGTLQSPGAVASGPSRTNPPDAAPVPPQRADALEPNASQSLAAPVRDDPRYVAERELPLESIGTDDSDFVECLVPGPGDRMMIVRLPKTIRMRYGQPSEQYFIRSVSH
jgi:hypothetical protein